MGTMPHCFKPLCMRTMKFRKDINALRAIAVIAVVLYHFNPSWLSGGFAGVDVFFVISGYLMTGIIFRGFEKNSFSLLKFYASRGSRIIPPLAVLCLILLILGYFFLLTWDYKTLGRDISTSMSFVSSLVFSLKGDYFEVKDNFLLHTWSLSTEWQFYIIYPLLLVTLCKFTTIATIKKIIVLTCCLGFAFSVFATFKWPTPSYYLLPTRAWEMLLGGIAYLYPMTLNNNKKRLFSTIGLVLISASYVLISKENQWPGYLAFFPVMGAFLVIQAQQSDNRLFNNLILQKIGLWSYSIYLWHWPIAVSFSYYHIDEDYKLYGILLSIFLGFISFTLIENRKRKVKPPLKTISFYILVIFIFSLIGAYVFKTQGIAQRETLLSNSLILGGTTNNYIIEEGVSLLNSQYEYDYLLLGDSNANHYIRGILERGTRVKHSWYPTCLSFPNSMGTRNGIYSTWKVNCRDNYKLGLNTTKNIIIAQSWERPSINSLECTNQKCTLTNDFYVDLKLQLKELFNLYGTDNKIYLIGQLPKPENLEIVDCLKSKALLNINLTCNSNGIPRAITTEINTILNESTVNNKNVHFIDPTMALCSGSSCTYNINDKSVFMTDGEHLSGYGSEVIWNYIMDNIELEN
jgi:peptidoglycan/LPS O-acetylase OafA/YrhL